MANEEPPQRVDLRLDIVKEISNLSRALGQIQGPDPALDEAREAFMKLTILIGEAMDIKW